MKKESIIKTIVQILACILLVFALLQIRRVWTYDPPTIAYNSMSSVELQEVKEAASHYIIKDMNGDIIFDLPHVVEYGGLFNQKMMYINEENNVGYFHIQDNVMVEKISDENQKKDE